MKTQTLIGREREADILALLEQHPQGLRQTEIARLLGCHSTTVCEALTNLKADICIDEKGRYVLEKNLSEKIA